MSIKAMTWVWERSPEKSTRLLMLLAIADHCNDEGVCYPSVNRLATKCRVSDRYARQVIDMLRQDGELGVAVSAGIDINGGRTNRYYLNRYRQSVGLAPVADTADGHEPTDTSALAPPVESLREGSDAPFRSPPEHHIREGGEPQLRSLPAEDYREGDDPGNTSPPEDGCTLTISVNRQDNHHPVNTHWPAETASSSAGSVVVCDGVLTTFEQEALCWSASHPFWSTRITHLAALRRNLAEGKSFRAQFLAARQPFPAGSSPGGSGSGRSGADRPTADDDPHDAFWRRFSGGVRGRLLEPDDDH